MGQLQEYKCPCCGASIEFDTTSQKMKCPYCMTEFEMETLIKYDSELSSDDSSDMEWHASATDEWLDGEDESIRVYSCTSCGGEVVADENTAASFCPYCNSPVVMKGNIKGMLKPEYIIPFKLDKNAAMQRFAGHLKGKKLLPKAFSTQHHIEEIKGIYVPYWLYDSTAEAHMRYKATRTRTWIDSNFTYTETSFFAVTRDGSISYEHVPVDGSSNIPNDLMESLEPFDFKEAVPFQSAYFSGYFADKYDVDQNECASRANERVEKATRDSFMQTISGFTSVVPDGGNIKLNGGKATYAMYPVWLLTTKWNDKNYLFAMNGQTGKFVGDLPVDKGAFKRYFFSVTAVSAVVVFAVVTLFSFLF